MAQIILQRQAILLQKKITNFGGSAEHDIAIEGAGPGLAFSLVQEGAAYQLLPGAIKIRVNGQSVSRKTPVHHCDRLEWNDGVAVFLDSAIPADSAEAPGDALESLRLLQNLAGSLRNEGAAAVPRALAAIVQLAGAEEGYLLTEAASGEWALVASEGATESRRKSLFSSTILKEALAKRAPVYVESIIGHPYAEAASVIAARAFSVACFPLVIEEEILGAVFLYTRTPGRVIQHRRLAEVNLLATQVALMLSLEGKAPPEKAATRFLFAEGSPMQEVSERIRKLAPTPVNILLLGETGTGKELAAREVHSQSDRRAGPFVAVNCASIPASLLESLLFGHERGAFTGAVKAQTGKFQQADGGTLFLDEIGDLPLELQAKLLRVLQERAVEPIGASRPQPVDVRVVAATHQNVEKMVKEKAFRQDLYFRLAGAKVQIPALRQRPMDIPLLARHFLSPHHKDLAPACLDEMQRYPWPGNVRELEQSVTRAAYLTDGGTVSTEHLELELAPSFVDDKEQFWEEFGSLSDAQSAFTRSLVEKALRRMNGNRQQTAERLGISERTLYRILSEEA